MNAAGSPPRWLRILLPGLALYALLGYLLVPWVLMRLAPAQVATALDARLEIEDLHFDPFRLRLLVFAPRLSGPLHHAEFDRSEVLGAERIEARLLLRSLRELAPVVALEVDAPNLQLQRAASGEVNLAALGRAGDRAEEVASSAPAVGIQRLRLRDGRAMITDHSRPQPFATEAEAIELDLRELWLPTGAPAPVWLGMVVEGATVDLRGQLSATPELDLAVTLVDLPLELAERWLADAGPADRLRGRLHLAGRVTLADDGVPRLADGQLQLHGLDLRVPRQVAIANSSVEARLRQLRVDAAQGSLWPLDLDVGRLSLEQGTVAVEYQDPGIAASPTDATDATDTDPAPWALRLHELAVADLELAVTDANLPIPARIDLGVDRLQAAGLHWPANPGQTASVSLNASLPPTGHSSFRGELDLAASRLRGELASSRLPLPVFAPWVHAYSRLRLDAGELGQQADIDLAWSETPLHLRVLLEGEVAGLALADPDGIDLLGWERLELSRLDLDLASRHITVGEVAVAAPTLRFARLEDGHSNFSGIGPVATTETEAASAAPESPGDGKDWHWEVARFAVDAGRLDFIDETLVIPFATRIESLAGSVDDLNASADRISELRLDGRIPPTGSARIEARGMPMHPLADTDLTLNFRGVPMPRMTPWTGTFAGYRVAGGRLDLDLAYRIEDGVLGASNRVTVNAMRLGERIDSPRAMDLPLRLALALLRDRDDNIILDVPVTGHVDDPQFNLQPVILRAIRNVLTNIATAPFRLLAGLVGGSEEALSGVAYELGSASLDDDQEAQLLALERALGQRPALALRLPARHAGEADRAVLAAQALERELAAQDEPREAALQRLYRERHGDEAFEALAAAHRSAREAAGREDGGDTVPPRDTLLTEVENRLRGEIEISDEALRELALRRAETVYVYLTDAGLDPSRLRIDTDVVVTEPDGEQVKLEFDLEADAM